MTDKYPTTCAELKAMIDAEWPLVLYSVKAFETFESKNCADIKDASIPVVHRVVRSCGLETEGYACENTAMLFTEEHAIRALWYQYKKLTPASDFNTGDKGVVFYWRSEPEVELRHGILSGRMRYSAVIKGRHGDMRSVWDRPNLKEVAA